MPATRWLAARHGGDITGANILAACSCALKAAENARRRE